MSLQTKFTYVRTVGLFNSTEFTTCCDLAVLRDDTKCPGCTTDQKWMEEFKESVHKYWHGTAWGCSKSPSGMCNLAKCNWHRTCVLREEATPPRT